MLKKFKFLNLSVKIMVNTLFISLKNKINQKNNSLKINKFNKLKIKKEIRNFIHDENNKENENENDYYENLKCEICSNGNDDENILICDNCNKGFHIYCLRPILPYIPNGNWYCYNCIKTNNKPKHFNINLKNIFSYVGVFDPYVDKLSRPKKKFNFNIESRQVFRVHNSSLLFEKRRKQIYSLVNALLNRNIKYCSELVYNCPKYLNNSNNDIDCKVQAMSDINIKKFNKYKELCKIGLFPPLLVCEDKDQGYIVKTDERILDKTILCEYIGTVYRLNESENKNNDSVMELINAKYINFII